MRKILLFGMTMAMAAGTAVADMPSFVSRIEAGPSSAKTVKGFFFPGIGDTYRSTRCERAGCRAFWD